MDHMKINFTVTEFVFLGLSSDPKIQLVLFFVFLLFYILSVVGNIIIITIIQIEPRLQTPMYFFLTNLSFLDICYTSTNVPQMLSNMVGSKKTIPFASCATQMYFSLSFGMIECVLLGVMAYDRYVAICHPLHYTVIMDQNTCVQLAAISWSSSFLSSMIINVLTLSLPYCGPNVLNHFFCEVPSVLRLACTDTSLTELVVFVFSIIIVFIPFLLIIVSYARILLSVLRMRSASGRHKALSTCASHLTVVTLFYGTAIFMYMRPQSKSSRAGGKVIAVFYTVVTPMLNPLIYSLRNQDVKGSLRRALTKQKSYSKGDEVAEFILLGLSDNPSLQGVLFALFLVIYMLTLVGNLGMMALIKVDHCLHTPMYFFLSSLSFVDASYSSSVTPKMLVNLMAEDKSISFNGCAAQFFFFGSFLGTECFLLAMMAYDRYAAIWSPLLYPVLMSGRICFMLVATSFLAGFGNAAIHTGMTFRLSFCGSNKINHFYCDTPPLLKLSCSDTRVNGIVIMAFSSFNVISCVLIVLISYLCILIAILKMPSAEGRHKAFSTCASHLMAVTIFFGMILFMYLLPTSSYSMEQDKVVSVFYTVVIPMLNPLIYSLKNKDVKDLLCIVTLKI
ncbi:olfactory receptor 2G3-like, partial [Sigmodon hispidus]